jgi:psiF repeat
MIRTIALTAALAVAVVGTAFAQAAAPAAKSAAPTAAPAPTAAAPSTAPAAKGKKVAALAKPRSPESIACSADADAKNIHGKPRGAFMKKCNADAKKLAKVAPKKN